MSAILLLTFVVPGIPSPGTMRLVILAALAISVLLEFFGPGGRRYLSRAAEGLFTATLMGVLIPDLWSTTIVSIVAIGIWFGLVSNLREVFKLMVVPFVVMAVAAYFYEPTAWIPTLLVGIAFVAASNHFAKAIRALRQEREDSMIRALTTSMSFVHVSDLTAGSAISITGPIEEITGWTPAEWASIDHRDLIHPDDLDDFWIDGDITELTGSIERKARFRHRAGHYVWLRDVSHVAHNPGGHAYLHGYTIDITEIERATELIRRQAEMDELTGLANRAKYIAELEASLDDDAPITVMIMDLDRFKTINDALGHGFGDDVLKTIGARLAGRLEKPDLVARLGGDEFAVISRNATTEAAAGILADDLARAASRAMAINGMTLSTTVSIGVAMAPDHGSDAQTLMRRADIAMYDAKRRGLSHRIFDAEIQHTPAEDLMLSGSITAALERDELRLHFQPKVSLLTGATVGFEGLARWEHPTLGLLTPDRFIHLITISDESQAFADHVIRAGIRFAVTCRDMGYPVPVAVNLSARSLFDDTLPLRTEMILKEHGLEAGLLVLEITEADIMDEAGLSSAVLRRLADLGVQISIDDFGTGYSSLSRLVDLPISEIKIDRTFVSQSTRNRNDEIVIRSIVDLAESLDLHIVAEGVETLEEVALLRNCGCTEAQGFLFCRPVPPLEALSTLSAPYAVALDLVDAAEPE